MYYFIRWRNTQDGKVADLPEDVDYAMLAEPSSSSDYALFECIVPDEYEDSEAVEPVSDYLSDLLESAKDYPPALALAREEVKSERSIFESEFAKQLIERLEFHLKRQKSSPYFMARRINRHTQWRSEGGFNWIVGYKSQDALRKIAFVSDDYYICHAPVEDFDVEVAEIEERFGK